MKINRADATEFKTAAELMDDADRLAALMHAEQHTHGSTNHRDFCVLYELARAAGGDILEVGIWHGKSTIALARGIRARGNKATRQQGNKGAEAGASVPGCLGACVYTYDVYQGGGAEWPDMADYCEAVNWWTLHGVEDWIIPIHGPLPDQPGRRFELAFIDGAHEHAPALRDLAIAAAVCPRIAVHDFGVPSVAGACREALLPAEWDCVLRSDSLAVFERRSNVEGGTRNAEQKAKPPFPVPSSEFPVSPEGDA